MNLHNVTTILALSFAATACGKKDNAQAKPPEKPAETKPAETKPAETKPAETKPAAAAMTECPKDDALKAKVAEMQKVDKAAVLDASCTAGKFPEPGFFIYSRTQHDGAEGTTVDAFTLITATGKVVLDEQEELPPAAVEFEASENFQAVDFDHDGTDEIVNVDASDRKGYATHTVDVRKIAGGKLESVFTRVFDYDDTAAVEKGSVTCNATWAVTPAGADGTRQLSFEPKQKPKHKKDECVLAKETWSLTGGKFVQGKA